MAQIYKLQNIPSVADYVKALKALGSQVKETHLRLFRAHYGAPNLAATAKQLAEWTKIEGGYTQVITLGRQMLITSLRCAVARNLLLFSQPD